MRRPMRRSTTAMALLAGAALLLGACETETPDEAPDDEGPAGEEPTDDDGTGEGEDAPVDEDATGEDAGELAMEGFEFIPTQLEVAAGETITITNTDDAAHTVTAEDGTFDVNVGGGDTGVLTVDEPGTYEFACSFHPAMTGTLTVS
jgi:plastocyanin